MSTKRLEKKLDQELLALTQAYPGASQWAAEAVAQLTDAEIAVVLSCVAVRPFPLGSGRAIYRAALTKADAVQTYYAGKGLTADQLRKHLAKRASEGCNAPNDSYVRIALNEKCPHCLAKLQAQYSYGPCESGHSIANY